MGIFEKIENFFGGKTEQESKSEIKREIESLISERKYILQDKIYADNKKLEEIDHRLVELGYTEDSFKEQGMVSSRLEELRRKENEISFEKLNEIPFKNINEVPSQDVYDEELEKAV